MSDAVRKPTYGTIKIGNAWATYNRLTGKIVDGMYFTESDGLSMARSFEKNPCEAAYMIPSDKALGIVFPSDDSDSED